MTQASQCSRAPQERDSLVAAALKVLLQPDPWVKAQYTNTAVELWKEGGIRDVSHGPHESQRVPDRPSRADDKVKLVAPGAMPKLGKGGTLASRQALLHSLVHIENWAIDLSWDIIARFGSDPSYDLPRRFYDDFVQVAADECSHFSSLCKRLEAIGSSYGALPAHDGLWESASSTSYSLPARLAVEHCVHEARGLDVLPSTVHKFRSNGDAETAALLEDVIYAEEISHCAAGVRWLRHLHQHAQHQATTSSLAAAAAQPQRLEAVTLAEQPAASLQPQVQQGQPTCHNDVGQQAAAGNYDWVADAQQYDTVEQWFHALIRRHFKGNLKPPFNDAARAQAGFGPEWYMPLTSAAAAPLKQDRALADASQDQQQQQQ